MFGQPIKKALRFSVLLATAGGFYFLPSAAAQADIPPVIINELMWMGSSASNSDEWIELRNLTHQPIDLTGWRLTKKSGGQESDMLTLPSGLIEPNGFFLIANYSADATQSTLAVTPDVIDTDVSLVNSSLQIKLYDPAEVLIDTADDGIGQPLAGRYTSGSAWQSMERNRDYADGTLETSWHTAEGGWQFDPSAPEFGTPRGENANPNYPPVAAMTVSTEQARVGEVIGFEAGESTDPDGDELRFHWNFGDNAQSDESAPTHSYLEAGTYLVTLTVTDGQHEVTESLEITITARELISPPAPAVELPTSVILNELFPNPVGPDTTEEFIELYNTGSSTIDLTGWKLADTSRSYSLKLTESVPPTIPANGYLVVSRAISGIALNNSGTETVKLISPDGKTIDEREYTAPVFEGQTYNRTDSGWQWSTTPTAGLFNSITQETTEAVETEEEENESEPKKKEPSSITKSPASLTYDVSLHIVISELLPNPTGVDTEGEFIELLNLDTNPIDLRGWQITDTKTYFTVRERLIVKPDQSVSFSRADTKINLNNSGDQIYVIDPERRIINGVKYSQAKTGHSWSRQPDSTEWRWDPEPTPDEPNSEIEPEAAADEMDPKPAGAKTKKTNSAATPTLRQSAIAELFTAELRTPVSLTGTVTVAPGVLGATFFYLLDETGGIQIASSTDFPELKVGDQVRLTGKVGEAQGERKVNVSSTDTIEVIGTTVLEPQTVTDLSDIEQRRGQLIRLTGTITDKRGQTLALEVAGRPLPISIKKSTGISLADVSIGQSFTVTGLLVVQSGEAKLLPRFESDIQEPEVLGAATETPINSTISVPLSTSSSPVLLYTAIALVVIVVALTLWRYRAHLRKRLSKLS